MKKLVDEDENKIEKITQKSETVQEISSDKLKIIVQNDLKELADYDYQKFHSNLCPGINNILGVRVPALRKYAKDFIKKYPNNSYEDIGDEFYEEIMLQGMLIGLTAKQDYNQNIKDLQFFVKKINNWAVCDTFVAGLKFIKKSPEKYWDFIKEYTLKNGEFEKRFGYVAMLDFYITDDYIDDVLESLTRENSKDYYVYMAVAWALSVCLIKYYDKTLEIMLKSKLNRITYNKALQKACESYRISDERKKELRSLKK